MLKNLHYFMMLVAAIAVFMFLSEVPAKEIERKQNVQKQEVTKSHKKYKYDYESDVKNLMNVIIREYKVKD
tara:strand:+ start:794 stop:1006 length:213 start_codon:yes stop_codon:yes gene_type:complete